MRRLLLAAVSALAFASPPPVAAQDAITTLNEKGCVMAADIVLVARSLSQEKVARDVADKIIARVYASLGDAGAAVELRRRATALAYERAEEANALASLVLQACMRSGGDPGAVFGTRIRLKQAAPRGLGV